MSVLFNSEILEQKRVPLLDVIFEIVIDYMSQKNLNKHTME